MKNTKSSSPTLIMECIEPLGQMWQTPGFRTSSASSQTAMPSPEII